MKLLMALSWDCFVAKSEDDDMSWTGASDKFLFKTLTLMGPRILFAGRKTADILPKLKGRTVIALSKCDSTLFTLDEAQEYSPKSWLIGGLTVAMEALHQDLITEAIIIQNQVHLEMGISGSPLINHLGNGDFTMAESKFYNLKIFNYQLKGTLASDW